METPVTIKLQSTFNPNPGWNDQVPALILSNGEVAVCGFAPQAVYTASDLQQIASQLQEITPEIASQLQQPSSRQQFRSTGRQQVQQGMGQQQQASNIRQHLQQGNT